MKKLGKKGVTLVELIVSFALVAVACVYFYQTLVTVTDLYRLASKETDDFVNEAYTFRILDSYISQNGIGNISTLNSNLENYSINTDYVDQVQYNSSYSYIELLHDTNTIANYYFYPKTYADKRANVILSKIESLDDNDKNNIDNIIGVNEEIEYSNSTETENGTKYVLIDTITRNEIMTYTIPYQIIGKNNNSEINLTNNEINLKSDNISGFKTISYDLTENGYSNYNLVFLVKSSYDDDEINDYNNHYCSIITNYNSNNPQKTQVFFSKNYVKKSKDTGLQGNEYSSDKIEDGVYQITINNISSLQKITYTINGNSRLSDKNPGGCTFKLIKATRNMTN